MHNRTPAYIYTKLWSRKSDITCNQESTDEKRSMDNLHSKECSEIFCAVCKDKSFKLNYIPKIFHVIFFLPKNPTRFQNQNGSTKKKHLILRFLKGKKAILKTLTMTTTVAIKSMRNLLSTSSHSPLLLYNNSRWHCITVHCFCIITPDGTALVLCIT